MSKEIFKKTTSTVIPLFGTLKSWLIYDCGKKSTFLLSEYKNAK